MQILNRISMRNIITFIFLTTLHFFVHAQNVPNGDFEKWRIRDHYKPAGMTATIRNAERSTDSWKVIIHSNYPTPSSQVLEVTDRMLLTLIKQKI
jgi:hypothetical protein